MPARWHDDYERGRPGYPQEAPHVAGLPRSATVLELGAGTGKLTRLLAGEFARVLAVEPDPAMRRRLGAHLAARTIVGAVAEDVPLRDESVEAVFAAEAFHWFAHERALAEMARVLRPRGAVVLMWNRPAGPLDPPIAGLERLLEPHWPQEVAMPLDLDPARMPYARDWPRAFTDSMFEPLEEKRFPNPQMVDRDGLLAFFGSMSWIATLADEERVTLLDEVASRLTADSYRLPFETHVHWTRVAEPD